MIITEQKKQIHIQVNNNDVQLKWPDGFTSNFHYIWLKDNCKSFLDPLNGQRTRNPKDISANISPSSVSFNTNDELEIMWEYDQHTSRFDLDWLRAYSYSNNEDYEHSTPILWMQL